MKMVDWLVPPSPQGGRDTCSLLTQAIGGEEKSQHFMLAGSKF